MGIHSSSDHKWMFRLNLKPAADRRRAVRGTGRKIMLFAVLCVLALTTLGPSATAGDNAVTGRGIRVWDATFMQRGSLTSAQAVTKAKEFKYLIANPGTYSAYVSQMRAANPKVRLLVYVNGTAAGLDSAFPEEDYAHDALGRRIRTHDWPSYLMEPSNSHWRGVIVQRCQSALERTGYDGCFLDQMGIAPLDTGYVTSIPVNPATGKKYTKSEWLTATRGMAIKVRDAISPKPVFINGLLNGPAYFDSTAPTSKLLTGMTGGMIETFVRPPNSPIDSYGTVSNWKKNVDILVDSAVKKKQILAMTKVWVTATQAQKDQWHMYALASFLLGHQPGYTSFEFLYDRSLVFDHRYWNVDLGVPLAHYSSSSGLYRRSFRRGLVLVNPTNSSLTTTLSGTYRNLATGNTVSGAITIQPHTGVILTTAA
jgi:hypothetical protein